MSTTGGMETIILENQGAVYERGPSSSGWTQLPAAMAQPIIASLPVLNPQQVSQLKQQIIVDQTKWVGFDVVDGTPAWVYDYATSLAADNSVSGTSTIWIGVTNGLPLKAQSTSNAPSGNSTVTTVITYQYDPTIKVQAPQ